MNEMCDIFIMCFVLFLFVTCFEWNFNAIVVVEEEEEEEGGRVEEGRRRRRRRRRSLLGVIMTNTEIKFHILLFTLSSSSKISDPLSYCHSIL
jgi:hypothetical protein